MKINRSINGDASEFIPSVGRLELDGMSVAFSDKASESEIYKGAQTF